MTNTIKEDGSWVESELSAADFNELRLNKRFQVIARELSQYPSLPINQASSDWAAAKAAYRFFQNQKVDFKKIIEPHILNTSLRTKGHDRVVVVQDSSVMDFSKHSKTKDLGMIHTFNDGVELKGLILHATLALSEKGLPLGLLSESIWARKKQSAKGHEHTKVPISEKESFRWIEGLRSAHNLVHPDTEIVMVCDREADIYELFEEALDRGVGLVVRLQHDRVLDDEDYGDLKIYDRLGLEKISGYVQVEIPSSGHRSQRVAELEICYSKVTLASQPRGVKTSRVSQRSDIDVWVVDFRESSPPKGESPLVWTLISTIEIRDKKSALQIMNYYKMRWTIELYFKTLKTGCNIESCRMNDARKLMSYIGLQSIFAWRLLWMTFLNRHTPEASCETMLTENEWKTLWLKKNRRKIKSGELKPVPPEQPPSVYEAVRWIAMQGGFLGRKNDGEPGMISIWRGWLQLMSAVEVYEILTL
ncbi:MAG: IS4 family transposase [Bdellovibrionaceae bacterium]|nr:IS4 family transposase [Pseudobdellovibrionaceae bacterium]